MKQMGLRGRYLGFFLLGGFGGNGSKGWFETGYGYGLDASCKGSRVPHILSEGYQGVGLGRWSRNF